MNSCCQVGYSFQAFWQSIPIATSKLGEFSLSYLPRVVAIPIASAFLGGGEARACVDPRVPGSRLLALLLYIFHNLSSSITINHHNFCCCHFHLINRPPPFTISLPGGPSERPADGLEDQGAQVLERLDGEQVDQTGCPPPGRLGSVNLRRTEEFLTWKRNLMRRVVMCWDRHPSRLPALVAALVPFVRDGVKPRQSQQFFLWLLDPFVFLLLSNTSISDKMHTVGPRLGSNDSGSWLIDSKWQSTTVDVYSSHLEL